MLIQIVSQGEIKKAFSKLSLKHHPDRGGDAEEFKKINEAYSTLRDVKKRKRMYDMKKEQSIYGRRRMEEWCR